MPFDTVTPAMIEDTVKHLTGIIEQTPPQYSAVKVDGKRAYDMARKDKAIESLSTLASVKSYRAETGSVIWGTLDVRPERICTMKCGSVMNQSTR